MMVTFETLRELALALPEVEEGTAYGTPAFRVRGKLFARLWEGLNVLVLRVDPVDQEALIAMQPETYFLTPHYAGHPYVLVRLAEADADELRERLADAWRLRAPKRLLASADAPSL